MIRTWRKDGATTRQERSKFIAQTIMGALAHNEVLIASKFIATCAYKTGLTEAKVIEIMHMLEKVLPFRLDLQNDRITRIEEEATEGV